MVTAETNTPTTVSRRPWVMWPRSRWEQYLADVQAAIQRAENAGQSVRELEACERMAESAIARLDAA